MTYKEKLKICPVCGKPHGLTVKDKFTMNKRNFKCKNCGILLQYNYGTYILMLLAIIFCMFMFWYTRGSFPNISEIVGHKICLLTDFLLIGAILSISILPLKPYHNYWEKFWNKGLK